MSVRIINGDCLVELPKLAAAGERFHCAVTDPPYELGFMGKAWDRSGVAFNRETWRAVYDCLLPGAHLLAFGGTRTQHRMVCAIEDAGFEVRDTLMWVFGAGFPKSLDVSKAIDKAAGARRVVVGSKIGLPGYHLNGHDGGEAFGAGLSSSTPETRLASSQITAPATPEAAQWSGWGTALKPAYEPVIVVRKPLDGTVASNVQKHGCGALNIDASRIGTKDCLNGGRYSDDKNESDGPTYGAGINRRSALDYVQPVGRWPANLIHDGSDEVLAAFPDSDHARGNIGPAKGGGGMYGHPPCTNEFGGGDSGSAARFFKSCPYSEGEAKRFHYSAKADASDRQGSKHPTVKPTDLMRYLVRLVCPPGGTVLDPFAGTGSTGLAAGQLGFNAVLIEQDATYAEDARRKLSADAPLLSVIA